MRSLLLVFGLLATPAFAAEQFDLVCTAKKASEHYRVDLARGEYCFGKCERVMKIAQVTSGMITFYEDQPTPPDNATQYNRINRLTGEWEWYSDTPNVSTDVMNVQGACTSAAFSGFPISKF